MSLAIDRRAFFATLETAAAIHAMPSEALSDALEHHMTGNLDAETTTNELKVRRHYNSVESQARFRTIPVNEFIDGVTMTSLGVQAPEAIQDCGFGVLQVWHAQDRFCGGAFSSCYLTMSELSSSHFAV
jgi:hypothetical protein